MLTENAKGGAILLSRPPVFRVFFQVPYAVSPLFATLAGPPHGFSTSQLKAVLASLHARLRPQDRTHGAPLAVPYLDPTAKRKATIFEFRLSIFRLLSPLCPL